MIYDNVLEALGNTPLIRLHHMTDKNSAQILVKFEGLNVGGSVKTRTAYAMIKAAEKRGDINQNSIIVEPTSGNQGIGIALVAAVLGYPAKIIMPDSMSEERRKLIKQYGAQLILCHDDGDIGKCVQDCIDLALRLKEENPNVFVPQQFENMDNVFAHYNSTAQEIIDAVNVPIDGFCSGIGTGGTITGIGKKLKEAYPEILIWALEPQNAAILSGGNVGTHMQMGIGDGLVPKILDQDIYDAICIISDEEALSTAKDLAAKEGLLVGISSGSNVAAAIKLAKKLGPGKTVVTLLPDTGERYFSTSLFD